MRKFNSSRYKLDVNKIRVCYFNVIKSLKFILQIIQFIYKKDQTKQNKTDFLSFILTSLVHLLEFKMLVHTFAHNKLKGVVWVNFDILEAWYG